MTFLEAYDITVAWDGPPFVYLFCQSKTWSLLKYQSLHDIFLSLYILNAYLLVLTSSKVDYSKFPNALYPGRLWVPGRQGPYPIWEQLVAMLVEAGCEMV